MVPCVGLDVVYDLPVKRQSLRGVGTKSMPVAMLEPALRTARDHAEAGLIGVERVTDEAGVTPGRRLDERRAG
jgi:hypothetical protein